MNLVRLAFGDAVIRVVEEDGECWFVGTDVALVLGYADHSGDMSQHCTGAMKWLPHLLNGGAQHLRLLDRANVTRLIAGSVSPDALGLELWAARDLLPQMLGKRSYEDLDLSEVLNDPTILSAMLFHYAERVVELKHQITQQALKVKRLDLISASPGSLCLREAAKVLQMSPSDLLILMQQQGWIHKRSGGRWRGHTSYIIEGCLVQKGEKISGERLARYRGQVRVTWKGVVRLAVLLANETIIETSKARAA